MGIDTVIAFVLGGSTGVLIHHLAMRKGVARTSLPHPLTRARSGWHSLKRTRRRNPTTPTVFPTILDERRYVVPPRPRYPDSGLPDHRPRLTPPPSRVARLDQLFKEYGESSQAMRDGLEDLARIVREQHGYVNDKKQWVPGSLHSDPEPPPDPSRKSPA